MQWTGLNLVFFLLFCSFFFNQDPAEASLIMPNMTMTNTSTNTNINWCIKLLQIHRSVHHLFGLYWDRNCWEKKMHSMFKRFSKWSHICMKTTEFLAGQIGKPLKMHDENVTSKSFNSNVTISHYPIIIVRATTGLLMWTYSLRRHVLHTNMCWTRSLK